jgi:SAM-dependent methyltransferase
VYIKEQVSEVETVQQLYVTGAAGGVRNVFGDDRERALHYYRDYIDFVRTAAGAAGGRLLDVGCGGGWSTCAFSRSGFDAVGVDLSVTGFEPQQRQRLGFTSGSVLALPFRDESFAVVATYQCIEHVPDPEGALLEILRVCSPGGVICVVGPNLASPLIPLRALLSPTQLRRLPLRRTGATPRHSYGNTPVEAIASVFRTTALLLWKAALTAPTFTTRAPDPIALFHADNDACYHGNPVDLVKFFAAHACEVIRRAKQGRSKWTYPAAGGTWVAVRKLARVT